MQAADVLAALAPGHSVSGAHLADVGGVTRAAIWKQVQALRQRGVPIQARGSSGYRLPWPIEMLDRESMLAQLDPAVGKRLGALDVFWEVDSTSSELQRRGLAAADFSMVLAESQSAGRGRRGRSWLSPPGLNLYLSCLKRFEAGLGSLSGLSLAIGVMLMRALDSLQVHGAGLKWPNDLLAAPGKLAGILVELSGEYQGPCTAVIGVGVNLRLTEELRAQTGQPAADLAQLCEGASPPRNRVAAKVIEALVEGLARFEREGFAGFVDDYARHDMLRDQPITLTAPRETFHGLGAGVDARGALRVRMDNGGERLVDAADISVRRA